MATQEPDDQDGRTRHWLAATLISVWTLGLIALGVVRIAGPSNPEGKEVFNDLLPVVSTWIGTILAFYFTRENYEAANRSVREMAKQVTSQEKLQSTPAQSKMIHRDKMHVEKGAAAAISQMPVSGVLTRLEAAKKGLRVPFLDDSDRPLHVIHRSKIDQFLARQYLDKKNYSDLTVNDLITDPVLGKALKESYGIVGENAKLSDVKREMEDAPGRQDVFVTEGGKPNGKVLGWITNVILEENSKV